MAGKLAEIRGSAAHAHVAPLAVFMGLMMVTMIPGLEWQHSEAPWYQQEPNLWLYPLQTVLVAGVLWFFWRHYRFGAVTAGGSVLAVVLGLVTIGLWILPSTLYGPLGLDDPDGESIWSWFGVTLRTEGFDPDIVADHSAGYWGTIGMRFARMVLVVPLVEELFWRGFLMRWLVDTDRPFTKTPFGTYDFKAVAITTGLVVLAHQPSDWLGALIFGSTMAWVAIRTKSLFVCVLMHAVANLVLGIYVMMTKQWGFW